MFWQIYGETIRYDHGWRPSLMGPSGHGHVCLIRSREPTRKRIGHLQACDPDSTAMTETDHFWICASLRGLVLLFLGTRVGAESIRTQSVLSFVAQGGKVT